MHRYCTRSINEVAKLLMSDMCEQANVFLAVLHVAGTYHCINCVYGLHAPTEHADKINETRKGLHEVALPVKHSWPEARQPGELAV